LFLGLSPSSASSLCRTESHSSSFFSRFLGVFQICEKFNASEKWLREGEGNMFISDEEALVNRLKNELHLNDTEVSVLDIYVNSPEDARQAIMDFILRISKKLAEERAAAEAAARSLSLEEQEAAEIAAVREKYRAMRGCQNVSGSDKIIKPKNQCKQGLTDFIVCILSA